MDDLSIFSGYGLLWGYELYKLVGPAGLIFIVAPLLGLWWHYTFAEPKALQKKQKKVMARRVKKALQTGDYEKVDIGLKRR